MRKIHFICFVLLLVSFLLVGCNSDKENVNVEHVDSVENIDADNPLKMKLLTGSFGYRMGISAYAPIANDQNGAYIFAKITDVPNDNLLESVSRTPLYLDFATHEFRRLENYEFTKNDIEGYFFCSTEYLWCTSSDGDTSYIARFSPQGKNRVQTELPGFALYTSGVASDGENLWILLVDDRSSTYNHDVRLCKINKQTLEVSNIKTFYADQSSISLDDVYQNGLILNMMKPPADASSELYLDNITNLDKQKYIFPLTENGDNQLVEIDRYPEQFPSVHDTRYYIDTQSNRAYFPHGDTGLAYVDLSTKDVYNQPYIPKPSGTRVKRIYGFTDEYYLVWTSDYHIENWYSIYSYINGDIYPAYSLISKEDYINNNPVYINFEDKVFG